MLSRFWRWLTSLFFRDRSAAETAERENTAEQAKKNKAKAESYRDEANRFANIIVETLTRKGICYRYTVTERNEVPTERLQEVKFEDPVHWTKETIKYKVDTLRLPRGIGIRELEDPEILRLISINCKQNIFREYNTDCGFWYVLEREYGVGGVPKHLSFEDAINSRPATLAGDRLAFPVGIASNRKTIWRTLPDLVNILVAGSPKWGKSNFVNSVICTLIANNEPKHLQLLLVDLKGGLEFRFYEKLTKYLLQIPKPKKKAKKQKTEPEQEPEAAPISETAEETAPPGPADEDDDELVIAEGERETIPGLIFDHDLVPAALGYLISEAERRFKLIREADVKNIGEYNRKNFRRRPLPYILCVIDEWADVKLNPKLGAKAEEKLINVSNRARAVGIHVIICTQSPNSAVVGTRVTNAMNSKMVFHCANQYMSMALVQDYSATELDPPGRAIFMDGSDRYEVQSAFMPNATINQVVSDAIAGKHQTVFEPKRTTHDVTLEEVCQWALSRNGGSLAHKEVRAAFSHRGLSDVATRELHAELLKQRFMVVSDKVYRVWPGNGFPNPRPVRLLPASAEEQAEYYSAQMAENDVDDAELAETPAAGKSQNTAGNPHVAVVHDGDQPTLPNPETGGSFKTDPASVRRRQRTLAGDLMRMGLWIKTPKSVSGSPKKISGGSWHSNGLQSAESDRQSKRT